MTDDDITAFRAAPPPAPAARRRHRVWPWLVLALALLMLLLTAGALAALLDIVGDYNGSPLSVTIDGDTWRLGTLHGMHGTALVGVLGALLLGVLLVVPVAVLTLLLVVVVAVGLALLAAVVVVGIALSPLLLLGALVWWLVRPRRAPALAAAR